MSRTAPKALIWWQLSQFARQQDRGESLPMIGKLLGHTQVQTTARYAHLQDAPMHQDPDRLMNEVEAAQILGYTIRCLQNWRLRGGGPRFVKVSSRSIRYRRRDLNEWIESKLATSTSEMCNG